MFKDEYPQLQRIARQFHCNVINHYFKNKIWKIRVTFSDFREATQSSNTIFYACLVLALPPITKKDRGSNLLNLATLMRLI